jgi:membrane protein
MTIHSAGEVGEYAASPLEVPMRGWGQVVRRVIRELSDDQLSIIAAGVSFYGLLAIFPAIAAFVTLYGLIAEPATVERELGPLREVVPPAAYGILAGQLRAVASQEQSSLSLGLVFGLAVTLWSAMAGIKTIIIALNIAYEEKEQRSFVKLNLLALFFTLGGMVFMVLSLFAIAAIPAIVEFLAVPEPLAGILLWVRWLAMALLAVIALALIYRFGPSRRPARWHWIVPGAILAALLLVAGSIAFSFYVANFADYNATFGSLGAVVILLMWFFLSGYAVGLGAELNAELERQTQRDTTVGPAKPPGSRGAYVADHSVHGT